MADGDYYVNGIKVRADGAVYTTTTANMALLAASSGSSLVGFIQSGTGAVAGTVQGQLRKFGFLSDFDTEANFNTFRESLTGTMGVSRINVKQNNGVRYQTSTGYGPFTLHTQQSVFNGTIDNTLMIGYNVLEGTAGTKIVSGEPTLFLSMESDYNSGSQRLMEMNVDYLSSDGLTSRRYYGMTIDKSTHEATFGWNAGTLTLKDSTATNQWFSATITSTVAAVSLGAGTTVTRTTNNASWLTQRNAANSADIELVRINASNQVNIAPAGGQSLFAGLVGIGETNSARSLYINMAAAGVQQSGVAVATSFGSDATTSIQGFASNIGTAAASFTAGEVIGFLASNVTKGSGSTITIQEGFRAANQSNGTTNIGFRGLVSSGSGKYNLYMDGTADNYLNGNVGIGTQTFGTNAAQVLSIETGTAPTTGPADTVQVYSSDNSAGNTIPSFFCEGTEVIATGQADSVSSVRVKMRVNGTVVTLLGI